MVEDNLHLKVIKSEGLSHPVESVSTKIKNTLKKRLSKNHENMSNKLLKNLSNNAQSKDSLEAKTISFKDSRVSPGLGGLYSSSSKNALNMTSGDYHIRHIKRLKTEISSRLSKQGEEGK